MNIVAALKADAGYVETSTVIEGKDNIEWAVMRMRLSALKLEIAGLKGRRSAYAAIKREYGLRGNKARVYEQFAAMVEAARPV